MMNPLSKKKLIQMSLTNSSEISQAGNGDMFIEHMKAGLGWDAGWHVMQGFGEILHTSFGRGKDVAALDKAKEWAATEFGHSVDWEKDPFGGWHPKGTLASAVAASKDEGFIGDKSNPNNRKYWDMAREGLEDE